MKEMAAKINALIPKNSFVSKALLSELILVCAISTSFAQNVESISSEGLKDVSADEVYWVVDVTCQGLEEAQTMQQRSGEGAWCALELPQLCQESKTAMAEQLCSEEYQLLSASDDTEATEADIEPISEPEPAPEPVQVQAEPEPEPQVQPVVNEPVQVQRESPVVRTPAPAQPEPTPVVSAPTQNPAPAEIIQSEPIQVAQEEIEPSSQGANTLVTAEEIAIEEELIRIEEEMLELRLREIELGQ